MQAVLNDHIKRNGTTLDAAWSLMDLQRNLVDVAMVGEEERGVIERGSLGSVGDTPRTNGALLALYARSQGDEGLEITRMKNRVAGRTYGQQGGGAQRPFRVVFSTDVPEVPTAGGRKSVFGATEQIETQLASPVRVRQLQEGSGAAAVGPVLREEPAVQENLRSIDSRIHELEQGRKLRSDQEGLQRIDKAISQLKQDREWITKNNARLNREFSLMNTDVGLLSEGGAPVGELVIDYNKGGVPEVQTAGRVFQPAMEIKQSQDDDSDALPFDVRSESRMAEQGMTAEAEPGGPAYRGPEVAMSEAERTAREYNSDVGSVRMNMADVLSKLNARYPGGRSAGQPMTVNQQQVQGAQQMLAKAAPTTVNQGPGEYDMRRARTGYLADFMDRLYGQPLTVENGELAPRIPQEERPQWREPSTPTLQARARRLLRLPRS